MQTIDWWYQAEKELETLIKAIRIFSQDMEMDLALEKCVMLTMKIRKRETTERIKMLNQEDIIIILIIIVLREWITLTLSRHPSLSSIASGRSTSCIVTELLIIGSCWSSKLCASLWRGPPEYITYGFVPTSPAVSRTSGSPNLDSFRDGGRWPYSYCFGGCCLQDLFNRARSILV